MGGLVARAFALNYPQRLAALVVLNSVFNRTPEQSAGVIARAAQAAELGPDANVDAALDRWFSREYKAANPAQVAAIRQVLASNDPQATTPLIRCSPLRTCTAPTTWAVSRCRR